MVEHVERGAQYADPFQDIACSGGNNTPPPTGPFTCTVSTNGNAAVINYAGDRGSSTQLLQNGSWIRTVTNDTQTTVSGGAGDSYTVRIRGANYADPFEDIACN